MNNKKVKKYNFIYKTTCIITNRFYIGVHSTDDINDKYLGSGKRLWHSIKYHGIDNHKLEILKHFDNREELLQYERDIVNEELLKDELCMNLCVGGGGGYISLEGAKKGRNKCDEILKEKYGDNYKSILAKNFHKNMSIEEKEKYINKIKESHKNVYHKHFLNKKHSDESKKKMSLFGAISQKGEKNSQFGTCWITKEEENKKIKKEELDFYLKEGWKKGRTEIQNIKRVSQIDAETNEILKIWNSIAEACEFLTGNRKRSSMISKVCRGKCKTTMGFIWRYTD